MYYEYPFFNYHIAQLLGFGPQASFHMGGCCGVHYFLGNERGIDTFLNLVIVVCVTYVIRILCKLGDGRFLIICAGNFTSGASA